MIPIQVGGNTYTSISAAWRGTGKQVPLITVRWRLRHGWRPYEALMLGVVPPKDRRTFKEFRNPIHEVSD